MIQRLASVAVLSSLLILTRGPKASASENLPHYDLEMTGSEYSKVISNRLAIEAYDGAKAADLQMILDAGKRNLDWLKFINDHRDSQHQISLSSPATQGGIPIDHPRFYNPELIMKTYNDLLSALPANLKEVILGTGSFPLDPPTDDATFITWSAKVDGSYQMASRWVLMSSYLDSLAERQSEDVRGYYFLSQEKNLKEELKSWSKLSADRQKLYSEYLKEMCLNNNRNGNVQTCDREVAKGVAKNRGYDLYSKYEPGSKALYDSFFIVQVPRHDVKWDEAKDEMIVPFNDPHDATVKKFLVDNIQDEWRWNPWHLVLNFLAAGDNPSISFQAGATPHVNGLAGNTITMDANQPLSEYNVTWTIRHEFGHVLGFPDCYVEFYDRANAVMVSYQLDITNLMCSRRGHLQELHFEQLKKTYGHSEAGLSESNL